MAPARDQFGARDLSDPRDAVASRDLPGARNMPGARNLPDSRDLLGSRDPRGMAPARDQFGTRDLSDPHDLPGSRDLPGARDPSGERDVSGPHDVPSGLDQQVSSPELSPVPWDVDTPGLPPVGLPPLPAGDAGFEPGPDAASAEPATPPEPGQDPTLAALAERIRELQALAASPSPPLPSPPVASAAMQRPDPHAADPEPADDTDEPDEPDDDAASSTTGPTTGAEIVRSRASFGLARQDDSVSDPGTEADSAHPGRDAFRDEPTIDRLPVPHAAVDVYAADPAYPPPSAYRTADRPHVPADASAGPQDRPARGSLAELRQRLARLPAGHPSSAYDDQGALRPAPQQLRQLELPLADEERETDAASRAGRLAVTAGERNGIAARALPAAEPAGLPAGPGWNGPSGGGGNRTGSYGEDHDLASSLRRDTVIGTRDGTPGPANEPPRNGTDPYSVDASPPAERPANGHAERADPLGGDWRELNGGGNGHTGSFARPADLGPAGGPAASLPDRAEAGVSPQFRGRLTAQQEELADQALSKYRAADGRNMFGGYGESGLTPVMRRVEANLPHGRLAPDSEQFTLKTPERYKEKLARMIARSPGVPAEELAAEIYDAARFTFVFEPQDYTDGTWLVHRRLKAQGFELEARRNRWDNPEYKGIRTRWRDPAHDLAFEVQFHTPASWDVLQRSHEAYLRITDPHTPAAERAQLRARQAAAAAASRPPARYAEIGDFRADVR
jgi:hypothetical protein